MSFYMDTNVWIARWKPDDPHHAASIRLVEAIQGGRIEAATSVLTLVEGAATFARRYRVLGQSTRERLPLEAYVGEQTRRLLALPLEWIHVPGELELRLHGTAVSLPAILQEALALAAQTPQRTLDLLHLAAGRFGHQVLGLPLEAFVTGDRTLLQSGSSLRRILGFPLEDPTTYVSGMDG